MSSPLLVELFDQLPAFRPGDDEDLWAAGLQEAMREFRARGARPVRRGHTPAIARHFRRRESATGRGGLARWG